MGSLRRSWCERPRLKRWTGSAVVALRDEAAGRWCKTSISAALDRSTKQGGKQPDGGAAWQTQQHRRSGPSSRLQRNRRRISPEGQKADERWRGAAPAANPGKQTLLRGSAISLPRDPCRAESGLTAPRRGLARLGIQDRSTGLVHKQMANRLRWTIMRSTTGARRSATRPSNLPRLPMAIRHCINRVLI